MEYRRLALVDGDHFPCHRRKFDFFCLRVLDFLEPAIILIIVSKTHHVPTVFTF